MGSVIRRDVYNEKKSHTTTVPSQLCRYHRFNTSKEWSSFSRNCPPIVYRKVGNNFYSKKLTIDT